MDPHYDLLLTSIAPPPPLTDSGGGAPALPVRGPPSNPPPPPIFPSNPSQISTPSFSCVDHRSAPLRCAIPDQRGIIPVDVHVWQIAVRDFDPTLVEAKSLTPAIYDRVGDLFRDRYGSHAGWAHSLLFAAELPGFKTRLPIALQDEMAAFQEMEKQRKVELKEAKTARAKVASPKAAKPSAKVKAKAKVEAKVVVEATAEVGVGVTVKEEEEEEEGAGPTAQKASAKGKAKGKAKAKAKVKAERDPEGPTSATKKRRT